MKGFHFKSTDKIFITGQTGSGKTTLARHIQKCFPRLVIFDRVRDYENERGEGIFHVSTFETFGRAIAATLNEKTFKIIFSFDIDADNHDDVFNMAMRVCYKRWDHCEYQNPICVVVDEIHNFATPHFIPKYLKESYLSGRHQNLGIIAASQRPANVHKDVLAQSTHLFCANFSEANDIKYFREKMGEHAEKLRTLPQFEFLHFQNGATPVMTWKVEPLK